MDDQLLLLCLFKNYCDSIAEEEDFILLYGHMQCRTRNYLTTACLSDSSDSPWTRFDATANDNNFIALLSLDRQSFDLLATSFALDYTFQWQERGPGRPRKLKTARDVLALLLVFYCSCAELKEICCFFGVPPSTASRTIRAAEEALSNTLKRLPQARIKWPSLEEQREWGLRVENRNNLVKGRWGFIDGKNYKVQKPSADDIQNAYYNGWLHAHLVTNVVCFGADGTVVWAKLNCPGSWNDGEMSRLFQERLSRDDINLPGHGVLADSAFPVSGLCFNRIVTPLKEGEIERVRPDLRAGVLALSGAITSMRQAAEWGQGSVQKVYRCLLKPLPFNQKLRALRLSNIYQLFNYRTRTTGISEILNYFLD